MIKSVSLGEELVISTSNKVGLLAEIATMLAAKGINIEAALGYEQGKTAKLMLVTSANLAIVSELRKKKYKSVKETEVVMVELENKPGTIKIVTTELKKARIDIRYLYVTSPGGKQDTSKMVISTSDNEAAIALLSKYTERGD